jgi:3-oxoacyl-(acyl-carrier-protein) synthase
MNNSELYASLQCSNPIEEYNFNPISRYQKGVKIQHVMTNSFGFGGNCTSIILSKCL